MLSLKVRKKKPNFSINVGLNSSNVALQCMRFKYSLTWSLALLAGRTELSFAQRSLR